MEKPLLNKKGLRISKVVALNLIPLAGIILFQWKMFEVAMTYLLETFVAFFIMDFDKYFVDKKTRVGLFFGVIQLLFILPLLIGFIFGYGVILYLITTNDQSEQKYMVEHMTNELFSPTYFYILLALFVFETIHYVIKNKDGRSHKSSSVWFNVRKILIVHFFIMLSVVVFGLFNDGTVIPILFLILFKVVLDYAMEDEQFFTKVREYFMLRKKKE